MIKRSNYCLHSRSNKIFDRFFGKEENVFSTKWPTVANKIIALARKKTSDSEVKRILNLYADSLKPDGIFHKHIIRWKKFLRISFYEHELFLIRKQRFTGGNFTALPFSENYKTIGAKQIGKNLEP